MKSWFDNYVDFLIRYPKSILVGFLLLIPLLLVGASQLSVDTDLRVFFSKDNPQLHAFEELEKVYSKNDNIFIAVSVEDGTVFDKEVLAAIEELTEDAWKIPHSSRVDSITNFQHSYGSNNELYVEKLVTNARALNDQEIAKVRQITTSEPLLVHRLISDNEKVTGINIDIVKPEQEADVSPAIASYVYNLIDEYKLRYPSLQFHVTGWIMIDSVMGAAAQEDVVTLVPLMFLLLIAVMMFCLRSYSAAFMATAVILLSMLTGMSFAGWAGIKITGPSSTAPAIILTLALADSIHVLLTILAKLKQGQQKDEAIRQAIHINFWPVVITSVTTAIGFLTMNFSDAPPFRDLGNIVAVGIFSAMIYSLVFLPALVNLIVPKQFTQSTGAINNPDNYIKYANFVIRHRIKLLIGSSLVAIITSLGMLKIELNDDFIRYFDERYQYRIDSEYVMDNLTGLYTIEYSLSSGESGGIHKPDYLRTVESFSDWYLEQPEAVHVSSFIPIIKKLNMNINGDDKSYYRIPDDADEIAQFLLLFEVSLPFGQDLNNQIDIDKSSLRVIVTLNDVTANEVREIDERAQRWLVENAPPFMRTDGTGLAMMYAHLSERNIKSMMLATFGMLILISIILIFAFKSVKFGVLSLLPNLMPAFMAFGVWGLTMERIGIPASVLLSLAVGIVVDDTVHFISKYLRARRDVKLNPNEAIVQTFVGVGPAIVTTTVTLVIGFAILLISGYKPNSDMGLMTGLIVALALLFDFIFLPTMILSIDKMDLGVRVSDVSKPIEQLEKESERV